ncbi:MAG: hypothetical protein Q4A74_02050 [Cardiobacteriaceae bacterium]|nr:hypothetical protein [Cardiobacteriaceae bacterium]
MSSIEVIKMERKMHVCLHQRQHGIVLLSCLVFLLILIGIVRFSMTSARLEERKSGVDYELLTAKQSAQTALRQAESFILKEGLLYCKYKSGKVCNIEDAPEYANELWGLNSNELIEALNKSGDSSVEKLLNNGIYTREFVEKGYKNCNPFWSCVDWSNEAKIVTRTSVQLGAKQQKLSSIECINCTTISGIKPRYIIERFTATELDQLDQDNTLDLKNKNGIVVLRITAVGFGNGDNKSPVTNAAAQATYILNG